VPQHPPEENYIIGSPIGTKSLFRKNLPLPLFKGKGIKGIKGIGLINNLKITSPIKTEELEKLTAGTQVLISGVVYTARDAAHQRLIQALEKGKKLPFNPKGQTLYYMGPSPAKPGQVIGSAGPTTSRRMDKYTLHLIAAGIRAMIGKGDRSPEVREAMKKHKAVYLATIGGAGALLSKSIKKAEVIAYDDLGAEAILRLNVEDFPAIVANDIYGGDLFEQEKEKYKRGKEAKPMRAG
jgi:fumarate hydratase subunit beta